MTQEIESIKPTLSVILDDGDWIINSTGPVGKAMAQAVLPLAASAHKVTIIQDSEMRVMRRNPAAANGAGVQTASTITKPASQQPVFSDTRPLDTPAGPDIQDQFAADLAAGRTGEAATGEVPAPTPGPSDPVKLPAPTRRKPVIFQDAAAPPAPELAEAEMARLLEEAAQAEREQAALSEQQRFQQQQAVQAGDQSAPAEPEAEATTQPRRRTRERTLATTGRPCGRCGGGGQIVGDSGFAGACPVCHGEGTVKTWDRSLKVR